MHYSDHDLPCREFDPEVFFPDRSLPDRGRAHEQMAIRACRRCPVMFHCRAEQLAAEHGEPRNNRHGIYGATTPLDRWQHDTFGRVRPTPPPGDEVRAPLAVALMDEGWTRETIGELFKEPTHRVDRYLAIGRGKSVPRSA